jgi:hypothetical protein
MSMDVGVLRRRAVKRGEVERHRTWPQSVFISVRLFNPERTVA